MKQHTNKKILLVIESFKSPSNAKQQANADDELRQIAF